jgi:hypothetical protein
MSAHARLLLMLTIAGLTLAACTTEQVKFTDGSIASGTASARMSAPRPLATAGTPGFLYWTFGRSTIRKVRLSDGKDYRRSEYGTPGGFGLAVGRRRQVFEAFSNSSGGGGVAICDKNLVVNRMIDIANEYVFAVAVDHQQRPYVLGYLFNPFEARVDVFARDASGAATPLRTLAGRKTGMGEPTAIALDAAGNLYVANVKLSREQQTGIEVFAPGVGGNRAPIQIISGSQTGIIDPVNIVLGADENIYVANQLNLSGGDYDILVFPASASGDVAPVRVLNSGKYGYTGTATRFVHNKLSWNRHEDGFCRQGFELCRWAIAKT